MRACHARYADRELTERTFFGCEKAASRGRLFFLPTRFKSMCLPYCTVASHLAAGSRAAQTRSERGWRQSRRSVLHLQKMRAGLRLAFIDGRRGVSPYGQDRSIRPAAFSRAITCRERFSRGGVRRVVRHVGSNGHPVGRSTIATQIVLASRFAERDDRVGRATVRAEMGLRHGEPSTCFGEGCPRRARLRKARDVNTMPEV